MVARLPAYTAAASRAAGGANATSTAPAPAAAKNASSCETPRKRGLDRVGAIAPQRISHRVMAMSWQRARVKIALVLVLLATVVAVVLIVQPFAGSGAAWKGARADPSRLERLVRGLVGLGPRDGEPGQARARGRIRGPLARAPGAPACGGCGRGRSRVRGGGAPRPPSSPPGGPPGTNGAW